MEHSKNFKKVKEFYKNGIWSKKMAWNAVGKWITPGRVQGNYRGGLQQGGLRL